MNVEKKPMPQSKTSFAKMLQQGLDKPSVKTSSGLSILRTQLTQLKQQQQILQQTADDCAARYKKFSSQLSQQMLDSFDNPDVVPIISIEQVQAARDQSAAAKTAANEIQDQIEVLQYQIDKIKHKKA